MTKHMLPSGCFPSGASEVQSAGSQMAQTWSSAQHNQAHTNSYVLSRKLPSGRALDTAKHRFQSTNVLEGCWKSFPSRYASISPFSSLVWMYSCCAISTIRSPSYTGPRTPCPGSLVPIFIIWNISLENLYLKQDPNTSEALDGLEIKA